MQSSEHRCPTILLLHSSAQAALAGELTVMLEPLEAAVQSCVPQEYGPEELRKLLSAGTHLLVIADHACLHMGGTQYALGYAAGRPLPVYLYVPEEADDPSYPPEAVCAASPDELQRRLQEALEHWRQEQDRLEAISGLAERGHPITDEGLALAVARGRREETELYFRAGFSANSANGRGVPLLCIAVRSGQNEMVSLLLEAGADVNAVSSDRGNTALMDAAAENNPEAVQQLIEAGSRLDIQSKNGQSALVLAVGQKRTAIARQLLEAGADPELPDQLGMSARGYARLFKLEELLPLMAPQNGKEAPE